MSKDSNDTFAGYLLATYDGTTIFPHQYMKYESWKIKPNQREEIKAYRDDNTRDLTRYTASGKKTAIAFSTRAGLSYTEFNAVLNFFKNNYAIEAERKIRIKYWNTESNAYATGYFYLANYEVTIRKITSSDIYYNEVQFDLVEY